MNPRRLLLRAAAVADGTRLYAAPGALLIEGERVIAAGAPQQIGEADATRIEFDRPVVLIPALVNAHAHLDLTHIGPVPFDGAFTAWVDRVRRLRARSAAEIAASVRLGMGLSRAGGTAMIGDIAGVRSTVPTQVMREQAFAGVSFMEVFGVGRSQSLAIESMRAAVEAVPKLERGVHFGLQPHAPYSCGPEVYRAAAQLQRPLATHLAETIEEVEFIARGDGALAEMLKRIGAWDDSIAGFDCHPIDHLASVGPGAPMLAAHLNYVDDRHLDVLADLSVSVAYCPRASAYFQHGPHRYREMLARGINVALGTDSMLCLDTPDRMSVLDEMRLLHRRDGTEPVTLLRMATINGARALSVRESLVTLDEGESAGVLAVEVDERFADAPLQGMLRSDAAPRWVLGPIPGRDGWFA